MNKEDLNSDIQNLYNQEVNLDDSIKLLQEKIAFKKKLSTDLNLIKFRLQLILSQEYNLWNKENIFISKGMFPAECDNKKQHYSLIKNY